jgi:hypothetical protein
LGASALGLLGEQHKTHHREETENKQKFEVLHDVPFDLADIFRSILWVPIAKSNMERVYSRPKLTGWGTTCR